MVVAERLLRSEHQPLLALELLKDFCLADG